MKKNIQYLPTDLIYSILNCLDIYDYIDTCKIFKISTNYKHYFNNNIQLTIDDICNNPKHIDIKVVEFLYELRGTSDTSLYFASKNGHLNIVKFLYKKTNYINIHNTFNLSIAEKNNHLDIVKFFIDCRSNQKNELEYILNWACTIRNIHIIKYICEEKQLKLSDPGYFLRRINNKELSNYIKYME